MASFGKREAVTGSILDRPLGRGRGDVSLSAFALLFSEVVQYLQQSVLSIADLERKLEIMGHRVGLQLLELVSHREKVAKRENRLIGILQFVSTNCWKAVFGKPADGLEKSTENDDEYMIYDNEPVTNKFVSVPKDLGQLNVAAYVAGMVAGVLEGAGFPARVTAHFVPESRRTVFLIKFEPEVLEREAQYEK